ncbi:MAG: PilZ domain-containing protein [Pseudomonadota bacterium]
MTFLEARQKTVHAEQRRTSRFTVQIPAIFRTTSGDRECRMANISDHGAKLETTSPPASGVSGMLVMGEQELYCRVVWSGDDACGIEFERALEEKTLVDIAGEQVAKTGPVANAGNIQMGRKRGRLVAGG